MLKMTKGQARAKLRRLDRKCDKLRRSFYFRAQIHGRFSPLTEKLWAEWKATDILRRETRNLLKTLGNPKV